MQRDLICKRCFIKVGEETTQKTNIPRLVKLCPQCKAESLELQKQILLERNQNIKLRKANSKRMSECNPMHNEDSKKKMRATIIEKDSNGEINWAFRDPEKYKKIRKNWKITPEGRKRISDRMKKKNPMKNADHKAKMVTTFKAKVESGDIVYKKGIEHHLWKGNRSFCDTLRVQLYPVWTKKCLERDNFTCTKCGSRKDLTVHHLIPLRNFVKKVLEKYNIPSFNDIKIEDWQKYFNEIIANHRLEDGVTLCKQCHSEEDRFYNYAN